MRNLVLEVGPSGEVSGSGDDCIGPFTISGTIAGQVRLVKQYVGRHRLLYLGTNSGEGILGTWRAPEFLAVPGLTSGRFALFPMRDSSSSHEAEIEELEPVVCG
jgi:hypothetical protein